MADGFNVVALRIDDDRAIVMTRRPVILAAGLLRGAIKRTHQKKEKGQGSNNHRGKINQALCVLARSKINSSLAPLTFADFTESMLGDAGVERIGRDVVHAAFRILVRESRSCTACVIEAWRREYNEERPKRALGGLTPAAYARQLAAKAGTVTAGL